METKEIIDALGLRRSLTRITHEIIEHNKGVEDIVLVGIKTRGEILAQRLAKMIARVEQVQVPCYALDVSHWRDDLEQAHPLPNQTMPVKDKKVILVDDVLFKGRTVRAAMDAISQMGRAGRIQLAVMIDRGHRELPIRPDYVGKNLPTAQSERVQVCLHEIDGVDAVRILEEKP